MLKRRKRKKKLSEFPKCVSIMINLNEMTVRKKLVEMTVRKKMVAMKNPMKIP